MTIERLPDESSVATPQLSPQFRERVFARARWVRRRRRTQRVVAFVALFMIALLGVSAMLSSWPFRLRGRPGVAATKHWSRALEDDLTWLETAGGSSLDEDSTNWAELAGLRGDPAIYLFPAYQTLQVSERQLALR
jgi:hypothetical protein